MRESPDGSNSHFSGLTLSLGYKVDVMLAFSFSFSYFISPIDLAAGFFAVVVDWAGF